MWHAISPRFRPAVWLGLFAATSVVAGYYTLQRFEHAHHEFDDPLRADGSNGHVQIDFGGQWVMARLFVVDGPHLYRRDRQRQVVTEAFPVPGDADALMGWFVGADPPVGDGVGGPLYPPVHGLLYWPLGLVPPQEAYRIFQAASVGLAVFVGFAVSRATRGRVWWPVAVVGVLLAPGSRGGLDLGQNHLLTLAVLAGGWWAMSRDRWVLGGVVWGLLAFKPTWAVAVLPVPLLMGRWRGSLAMAGSGAGLVVATLPVVGVGAWLDWLRVGSEASAIYAVNENWVSFSRDLGGLPRRLLLDFDAPEAARGSRLAAALGWWLLGGVLVTTAAIYRQQPDRSSAGLPAGFVLLGAYLGCYRFMYYDATLAVLPVAVLLADRRTRWAWVPLALVACLYLYENLVIHYGVQLTITTGAAGGRDVTDRPGRRLITVVGSYRYAWDTALLLGLWAWAGLRLLLHPAEGVEGGPDVGRPHERLAD